VRLGFDISDLYPHKAGVYTYAAQLLRHLSLASARPDIVLLEGASVRRTARDALAMGGLGDGELGDTPYARVRALPVLRFIDGPWQRRYRSRRLAWGIDRHALLPLWRWIYQTPALARRLVPRNMGRRLDVCHWSDSAFLRLPGVAHVMTVHDCIALRHPEWQPRDYVDAHVHKLRATARYATRIIADSRSTRDDVVALLGVPPDRIDVIPLAAGLEFRPPANRVAQQATLARYGLRPDGYVLAVGTIEPRKNLVRLAAAFKAALDRHPELPTRLVLAGGRGWLTTPIDAGLAALGLGDRLVLPGRVPQEDLPALLHGARAIAYVSLYEGFGLPPLEAMACGAAVVASNISSIPEVVGDAALLVDPYDVADIAAALGRTLTDDTLRAGLAARGLRRAQEFSWHRTAELTMRTYRRAIQDRDDARARGDA